MKGTAPQMIVSWWLNLLVKICLQCKRHRRCSFSPCIEKISWRKKWQPTPLLLPGRFHGRKNLMGYSQWGCKEPGTTKPAHAHKGLFEHHLQHYRVIWGTVWAHAFHKGSKLTLVDREKHKINPLVKLLSTNKQDVWCMVLWKQASVQGKQKRGNTTHVKWNSRIWLVRSNVLFLFEPKPIIASVGHFLSLYQWHLKQDKWHACKI